MVPPSVCRFSPLMQLAAALLWNTIGYACSSGVERRSTQVVNWSMRAARVHATAHFDHTLRLEDRELGFSIAKPY